VLLQLQGEFAGLYVEYVHVQAGSACVEAGDRVTTGETLCLSGDVGFCPRPHLHIQMHESSDPCAPTVKFAFLRGDGSGGGHYFPEAGRFYDPISGPVPDQSCSTCTDFTDSWLASDCRNDGID
jgi:murein DD-endopeptidase MepM/ murein hydrolase activator NlpD